MRLDYITPVRKTFLVENLESDVMMTTENIKDVFYQINFVKFQEEFKKNPYTVYNNALTNFGGELLSTNNIEVKVEINMSLGEIHEMLIKYCEQYCQDNINPMKNKFLVLLNDRYGFYTSDYIPYNGVLVEENDKYGIIVNKNKFTPVKDAIVDLVHSL